MTRTRAQALVALVSGFLFALGLGLSGMTQPHKVIGFLDIQNWDPTLVFVMIGAIAVHALAFYSLKRRKTPLLDLKWHLPLKKEITVSLIFGSALFGIGWGLGGYCPGPALTSVFTMNTDLIGFLLAMVAGMISHNLLFKRG